MNKPRAFSYLRFSTPEQQRGDSYRRQTELAERYAAENGLELDSRGFHDLGVSAFRGANAAVGMLGEFRRLVEEGAISRGSFLLVESLDRISRSKARKAVRLLEDICDAGITVVTLSDGKQYNEKTLDDAPMEFMYAFMVAVRAHEESAMKSGRLKAAWKAKRSRAKQHPLTAVVPAWLKISQDRKRFLVIDDRAAIVRRIFKMTAKGVGQHAIAQQFNSEGLPTFGKAAYWHRSYIAKLLANAAVVGTFVPHLLVYEDGKKKRKPLDAVEGYYPAIVDRDLYNQVQSQRLSSRAAKSGAPLKNLLAGLARCPKCHGTMTRVNKGKNNGKPRLVCARAKAGANCDYRTVHLDEVEQALIDGVGGLVKTLPSDKTNLSNELDALTSQLSEMQEHLGRVETELANGNLNHVTEARLKARLRAFHSLQDQIQSEQTDIKRQLEVSTGPALVPRMKLLLEAVRRKDIDRCHVNALLRQLFSGITVEYDIGWLSFSWLHGGESVIQYTVEEAARR